MKPLNMSRINDKLYFQEIVQPTFDGVATLFLGTKTGSPNDVVGEIKLRIKPESKLMAGAATKNILEKELRWRSWE